ncbi:MAG: leucine-rich repeat domain-containing protein [Gammaproteobacteria bacterium]
MPHSQKSLIRPAWISLFGACRRVLPAMLAVALAFAAPARAADAPGADVSVRADAQLCSRTLHVRNFLLVELQIAGVARGATCSTITNAHLAMLRGTMRLRESSGGPLGLSSLKAGDFAGLSGVTALDFQDNMITALPAGVFDGMDSLTSLDLSNNQLASVDSAAFAGLSSLRRLDLSHNLLTSLPPEVDYERTPGAYGVFGDLSALTHLRLNDNQLASLPTHMIHQAVNLERLHLENNLLTSVHVTVFDRALNTEVPLRINMRNNRLTSLPGEVFNDATSLTQLELSYNRLSALDRRLFRRQSKLEYLGLSHNHLRILSPYLFDGLSSLGSLDLSWNRLTALPDGLFTANTLHYYTVNKRDETTKWESLIGLMLHNNRLTFLQENVFANLPGLGALLLSSNRLEYLPPAVFRYSAVQWLTLGGNPWTVIFPPGHFGDGLLANAEATAGFPSRPRNLAATAGQEAESLFVTWRPPLRAGAGITQYRMRWKAVSAQEYAPADTRNVTANRDLHSYGALLRVLEAGGEYEVQVAAGSNFAFSNWAMVRATPVGSANAQARGVGKSGPPQNLRVTLGNGALALDWAAPADAGGANIDGYKVRWSTAAAPTTFLNDALADGDDVPNDGPAFYYRITGIDNGSTYIAQVAAATTFGTGDWARSDPVIPDANRLNVDGNDIADGADGVLILRYLIGMRGATLFAGLTGSDIDERGILENLRALEAGGDLDVDGNGLTNAADGIIIARSLLGVSGDALTDGQAEPGETVRSKVESAIEGLKTSP